MEILEYNTRSANKNINIWIFKQSEVFRGKKLACKTVMFYSYDLVHLLLTFQTKERVCSSGTTCMAKEWASSTFTSRPKKGSKL